MGNNVGFTNSKSEYGRDLRYPDQSYPPAPTKQGLDFGKVVKAVTAILGTLVLLGGLVWGAAWLLAGMASESDLDAVEDRVETVEKNDIRQTIILEQIKEAIDKIDKKLDKALEE
jgi:hypothetical protein